MNVIARSSLSLFAKTSAILLRAFESKLAKKLELTTEQATQGLFENGLPEWRGDKLFVTEKAKAMGPEFRVSKKVGGFFLWPDDLLL